MEWGGVSPMASRQEKLQHGMASAARRLGSMGREASKPALVRSIEDLDGGTVSSEARTGEAGRSSAPDAGDGLTLHQRMLNEIEAALCSDEPATAAAHVKLATDYARQLQATKSLFESAKSRFRRSPRG